MTVELKGFTRLENSKSYYQASKPAAKDAKGNFVHEQEKSDVVHDQACLPGRADAGDEQAEAAGDQGFLGLEREIGAKIEDLSPKTKVQEYYKLQIDKFLAILKKNKRKLNDYDPARREPQERLRLEFDASLAKLQPLMERIAATDGLIDQIVYKLYGLTRRRLGLWRGNE
jgi:hypothetical protein